MKPDRFYQKCYRVVWFFVGVLFYNITIVGKENIPKGAAMACANHSSKIDPFLLAFVFGIEEQLHIIAKVSLFKIPLIARIIRKLGMISVDRDMSDVTTIKNTLAYLKKGEKVGIFPEGTRVSRDGEVKAKSGAVKIAERAGVPVIPIFIPRKKPLLRSRKITVVIGEPFVIEKQTEKRTPEDYTAIADDLMDKIAALDPKNPS